MGTYTIKLPDVGEGVAEAELVEWQVKIGDAVREDDILASVMTDKATVEIPSPVEGVIEWLGGEVGETLSVGSPLVRLAVGGADGTNEADENSKGSVAKTADSPRPPSQSDAQANQTTKADRGMADAQLEEQDVGGPRRDEPSPAERDGAQESRGEVEPTSRRQPSSDVRRPRFDAASNSRKASGRGPDGKPLAPPAVRRKALDAGIDLRRVQGSGPAGRITHDDLDAFIETGDAGPATATLIPDTSIEEVRVVGLRRRIAEKMALARDRIVPITYVEEVDVEALEELRKALNGQPREDRNGNPRSKLTILPFLMRAIVIAVRDQPSLNALYDDEKNVLSVHGGVHIGIAAQTDNGLVVPVARHCEARDLWGCAGEAERLADAARSGKAKRDELIGSTITITSLGKLGGIVTTPVVNHPEVAIVGVNKIEVRPVWDGVRFVPRRRMNLSSSFDHRVIDGYDAAVFVQRIKTLIETPALIFAEA